MTRVGLMAATLAASAFAEGFAISIGNPVAAQDFRAKGAAFVFRTVGCADPAKSQISGTAEGLVKGTRRSVPLNVMAMGQPGVYAVYRSWPAEGESGHRVRDRSVSRSLPNLPPRQLQFHRQRLAGFVPPERSRHS